jgi:hypothetical protein
MRIRRFVSLLVLVGLGVFMTFPSAVTAQFHESFDSPTPSWQRTQADCKVPHQNWRQTRANEVQLRNRYEKIEFDCGPGTRLMVAHAVPPVFVISDLKPSVRIKASRAGVQLWAQVVLPHVPSPDGTGPLKTLLLGPAYSQTAKWQTLQFDGETNDLQTQLKEQLWLLRRKLGPHVSARDAYVDQIVLNLHCGAGKTIVQIDDLKIDGTVDARKIADKVRIHGALDVVVPGSSAVELASLNRAIEKRPSQVVRDGTVLLVKKKPFFPRIIQHHGEPFDFLSAHGFNTIELRQTATEDQLEEARRLGMWIVCPPPTSIGLTSISFKYDRVLAWSLGRNLTGRNLETIQQKVREIRQSDQREGRPVVANASSHWKAISQVADILSVGIEPLGTSFIASRYSDWIIERSQSIANSKPVWVDVQTQLTQTQVDQVAAISSQVPPTPIEPQQLKFLTFEAIAGGARGLRFKSRSRLDAPDPATQLRATTLEWLNGHVDVIEPWAVGGAVLGELPLSDDKLEVTALQTNRSRLLLVQRPTHHEQFWAGDVRPAPVSFEDSSTTFTDRAWQVTETGLQPLSHQRNPAGNRIRIESCPYATAIVLTQDPLVVNQVSQSFQRPAQQSLFDLHVDISRQWLAIMQLIDRQMTLMGRSLPEASSSLNETINSFRTVDSLVAKNSQQAALASLRLADQHLAFARRAFMATPLGSFQSKTSSPFVSHCSLIPLHWELAMRLEESRWKPNGLAGGDFENLQHMLAAGWENHRLENDQFATKVELAERAMVDGRYGCRLAVDLKPGVTQTNGPIESPPLWIATPPVSVKGGQLVRIHGWVNIPQTIAANQDGLTIMDSIAGEELMERIPVTDGWQEFTLYRSVAADADLKVTFSLTGLGEAMLDEVTIRAIDVPAVQRASRQASKP